MGGATVSIDGNVSRKAGGRRVFSAEFKRTQFQRILSGKKTVQQLSRELNIAPSVIRNWDRFRCSDCLRRVLEKNRARHFGRCPRRKVRCSECGDQHLAWKSEEHLARCPAIVGRLCLDCRVTYYSKSEYMRHRWERHRAGVGFLPSTRWTQSGEIRNPELVATGQAVQGGLPGSAR